MKKTSHFNLVPQHAQAIKSPQSHPQPNNPGKGNEPNKPGKGYGRDEDETVIILQPSTPEVTEFEAQIIGTADPFVTIIATYNDQQYQTTADAPGNWSLLNPISGTGLVTIVAVNAEGIASSEISLGRISFTKPNVPEVTEFEAQISGVADPFVTIVVTHEGQQYQTTADAQGNWSLLNPILGTGSVTIVAINAEGISSQQIGLAQIAPPPPSIPVFSQEEGYLVGTADPHITVVVRHNGIEYSIEADADGQWMLLNPLVPGTTMEVFSRNEFGEESPSIISGMAPLPEIPIFPGWTPITPVILDQGEYLSGKATPYTQIIVTANGHEYTASVDHEGNWSMLNPIAQGGTLELYAVNSLGLRSEIIALAIPMVFPEPQPPIEEPEQPIYIVFEPVVPTVLENDEQLAGQAMPYGKIVIFAYGLEYVTYANANGEWSIENPIAQGGFITLYSENAAGDRSDSISVAKLNFPVIEEQQVSLEELLTVAIEQQEPTESSGQEIPETYINLALFLENIQTLPGETVINPLLEEPALLGDQSVQSSPIFYSIQDFQQLPLTEQNYIIG